MAQAVSSAVGYRPARQRAAAAIWMANAGRFVAWLGYASRVTAPVVARFSARARRPTLTVGGLGCLTVAGFTVAAAVGWIVAGLSLLVLEALSGDGG